MSPVQSEYRPGHSDPFKAPEGQHDLIALEVLERESSALNLRGPASTYLAAIDRSVRRIVEAGRQLEEDQKTITGNRDLSPRAVARRLNGARTVAEEVARTAEEEARRAFENLDRVVREEALPTLDPDREQLARDEAKLGLDAIDPETHMASFIREATPETVAVLLTPWGRTYLRSRGVRRPDDVLAEVRKLTGLIAAERGETEEQRRAGATIKVLPRILAALSAAKGYIRGVVASASTAQERSGLPARSEHLFAP